MSLRAMFSVLMPPAALLLAGCLNLDISGVRIIPAEEPYSSQMTRIHEFQLFPDHVRIVSTTGSAKLFHADGTEAAELAVRPGESFTAKSPSTGTEQWKLLDVCEREAVFDFRNHYPAYLALGIPATSVRYTVLVRSNEGTRFRELVREERWW